MPIHSTLRGPAKIQVQLNLAKQLMLAFAHSFLFARHTHPESNCLPSRAKFYAFEPFENHTLIFLADRKWEKRSLDEDTKEKSRHAYVPWVVVGLQQNCMTKIGISVLCETRNCLDNSTNSELITANLSSNSNNNS